jgi:peptidoglycan/xylan/chitin deacetylase (PgdA/CDA1 family)
MFHEIHENDEEYQQALGTGCTQSYLDSVIVHLRRNRWDIVSLDEALACLAAGNPSRRFAVLTFDDGYRDTLTRALPVLDRHQAAFTAYIPTGGAMGELNCWWLGLRALFQRQDSVELAALNTSLDCRDRAGKIAGYNLVKQWVHQDYRRAALLGESFTRYAVSLGELNETYFMSPSELRDLADHPLVTIGAHTLSHRALANLEAPEMEREMSDSRQHLEQLLDRQVLHFAYPYGGAAACGGREYRIAKKLGFHSAVTTLEAPVFALHRRYPHQLPRIGLSGTVARLDNFAARLRKLRNAVARDFPELSL